MDTSTEPGKRYTVQVRVVEVTADGELGAVVSDERMNEASSSLDDVQRLANRMIEDGEEAWLWFIHEPDKEEDDEE